MSTTNIDDELMEFIIRKAEGIKSPFKISQLIRDFKREYKRMDSVRNLRNKILILRSKITKLEDIETEMKVKMLFGLHAPVDPDFLEKLKVNADSLKVDEFQRIIEYTEKKRGLKLRGTHYCLTFRDDKTDNNLLKFLVEKSKTVDVPFVRNSFLREFKSLNGNSSSLESLYPRYDRLKKKLFRCSDFDKNTRVKLLFISSARIPGCFLKVLQNDATVAIDEKGRITKYEAHDGSLILKGDHSHSSKMKLSLAERWNSIRRKDECDNYEDSGTDPDTDNHHVYEREMSQFIKFVIERAKSVNAPMNIRNMCEDFKKLSGSSNTLFCLQMRVRRFREKIPRMDEFDKLSKVRMMFALSTRVPDEFLNELRKDAVVQVDSLKRIIKYQANDGTLSLEGKHSASMKRKLALVTQKKKIAARAANDEVSDSESDEEGEVERKKMKDRKRKTAETENGKRSRLDLLRYVSESDEDESEESPDESDESEDSDDSKMSEIEESHKRRKEERPSTHYDAHVGPVTRNRTKQSIIPIQKNKTRTTTEDCSNSDRDIADETMTGEFELEQDVSRIERIVDDFEYDDPRDFDSSEGLSEEVITETDMLIDRNADGSGPSTSRKQVVRTPIHHSAEEDDCKPDVNSAQTENKENIVESAVNGEKYGDGRGNKDTISRTSILESLHTLLLTLELSSLESVQKRVETMLEEAGNNDNTLQVHGALIAFDTFLYMSMKEAAMKCPPGTEAFSLKEFLTVLRIVIISMKSTALSKFSQKLKVMITELSIQDKKIPVESITTALETTLNIISS